MSTRGPSLRRQALNRIGALGLVLSDAVDTALAEVAQTAGPESEALVVIDTRPDCTIAQLAGPLGLSHSGAVRLVDRLCAAGVVTRGPGVDARSVALELTTRGRTRLSRVLELRAAALQRAVAALDDDELTDLARIAETVLTHAAGREPLDVETRPYALCRLCETTACSPYGCPVETALMPAGAAAPHDHPPKT